MAARVHPVVAPPEPPRFWAPGLGVVDVLGEIVIFAIRSLGSIPRAFRYSREIWWYAAFLAIGSTPVALAMTWFSGSECSVEAFHTLHQLGAPRARRESSTPSATCARSPPSSSALPSEQRLDA